MGSDPGQTSVWTAAALADCRVTFDHPPINTISATTVADVAELVDLIEQDVDLSVVVFDSANADFYLPTTTARTIPAGPRHCQQGPRGGQHGPTSLADWPSLRCSASPRFADAPAAREPSSSSPATSDSPRARTRCSASSRLAPHVPAEGRAGRPSHLVGTGRALEILLVGDDLDEARAEEYGYVNRLIADDQLDGEVDRIASRVARLDRDAIRRTRSYFEQATLPEP